MKKAFHVFNTMHIREWFESRGVRLKEEPDHRVFPTTDTSQTIIDCLLQETHQLGISIELKKAVRKITPGSSELTLHFAGGVQESYDKVIVATGGSPRLKSLDWLASLGHRIEAPVPSLFTFNLPNHSITKLMGTVANPVSLTIQGTKLKSEGPLLITHWGLSGPAVLKLSAFGARTLHQMKYAFQVRVNWANEVNQDIVSNHIKAITASHTNKQVVSIRPFGLPKKLWTYLLEKEHIPPTKRWNELGKKGINKMVQVLTNDFYLANGTTTFKEEFVTCGGVSLKSVNMQTMQSKAVPNLYFAGEVLDIDGITGGYNFQSAWTTGFIAGKLA